MIGIDALKSVQHGTVKGKRVVIVDLDDWEALLEWLEMLEDAEIARKANEQLQTTGSDRTRAGWLT